MLGTGCYEHKTPARRERPAQVGCPRIASDQPAARRSRSIQGSHIGDFELYQSDPQAA
jgi:hypothetical protein